VNFGIEQIFCEIFWNDQINFRELWCNCMYLLPNLQVNFEIVINKLLKMFKTQFKIHAEFWHICAQS